uniref:WH2 domain-containing protein n=1 Tax=Angiostrongylus cantonensis TaxID=6313 RepID=A0A0K0DIU7_ANGCA
MITEPSKPALDISVTSESLNAHIPPVPPSELSDTIKKLRVTAGLAKKSLEDASMLKRTDLDANVEETSVTGARLLKPLQRTHSARSSTSAVSTGTSTGTTSVKSSSLAPKSSSLHLMNPLRSVQNATECSPLAVAARNLKF